MKEKIYRTLCRSAKFLLTFFKETAIALLVGVIGGLVGTAFHKGIELSTQIRLEHSFLLWFMPLGGVLIVFLYHIWRLPEDPGTNIVLNSVRLENDGVPFRMLPLIFIATIISQLTGASAGREGAALQIGGALSTALSKLLKLDERSRPIILICGMSAVFSALFGTPLTATIFSIEVISVGIMHYSALFPSFAASFTASYIASLFGCQPVRFALAEIPSVNPASFIGCALIGVICALISIFFCFSLKITKQFFKKLFKNDYLRALMGGLIVLGLSLIFKSGRYNGSGFDIVSDIFSGGQVYYWDFLLKIIFTSICLAVGFKGGEIVPTLFVGATAGWCAGALLGINPIFAAAVGMSAMFCGMTNTPVASIILGIEVFSGASVSLFAAAVFSSYVLSGNFGLYSGQKIVYSKLFAQHIDINAKQ